MPSRWVLRAPRIAACSRLTESPTRRWAARLSPSSILATTSSPATTTSTRSAEAVKAGIYLAGGVPFEVSTIGVCDGIAMNHAGMHYSLVSREVIADSLECAVEGHAFDGIVCIPNCDKIVPGMILGALRVNIPTVFVSGGPMLRGHAAGRHGRPYDRPEHAASTGRQGRTDRHDERGGARSTSRTPRARPAEAAQGMFTANSMNCLCEALGIALPGNGTIPAVYSERLRLAKHAGMKVMELLGRGRQLRARYRRAEALSATRWSATWPSAAPRTRCCAPDRPSPPAAGHPITMDDWDAAIRAHTSSL